MGWCSSICDVGAAVGRLGMVVCTHGFLFQAFRHRRKWLRSCLVGKQPDPTMGVSHVRTVRSGRDSMEATVANVDATVANNPLGRRTEGGYSCCTAVDTVSCSCCSDLHPLATRPKVPAWPLSAMRLRPHRERLRHLSGVWDEDRDLTSVPLRRRGARLDSPGLTGSGRLRASTSATRAKCVIA